MSLTLWKDITPLGQRLREPTNRSPHVLVIGGGVTGLVSSWVLLDRGYHVTILSSAWASDEQRLTSQIAGALYVASLPPKPHYATGPRLVDFETQYSSTILGLLQHSRPTAHNQ